MMNNRHILLSGAFAACSILAAPAMASGVRVTNQVLVQSKSTAADGTIRTALVPASRVVPGDRVVYRIAYHNELTQPVNGMVVNNPVPTGLVYRGPAEGSPAPDVSIDGKSFAPLAALKVRDAAGTMRSARAEEVKAVRWQVANAIPAGGSGQYAFEAILK